MSDSELSLPLRDAISIPEAVHDADFVLQLHKAQDQPDQTLNDYVVTPGIAAAFHDGLELIRSAFENTSARGTFVHGSFGAGKSHFMAVLHLLLTGNAQARALPGLQEEVAKYSQVLDRNLLAVDYHFVGAESVEAALFGGYLKAIRAKHADAPLRCCTAPTHCGRTPISSGPRSATRGSSSRSRRGPGAAGGASDQA